MEVKLLSMTERPYEVLFEALTTCKDSAKSGFDLERTRRMIRKFCIEQGHESILEHVNLTFKIEGISRACSHQLVRHRLCVFSQRSQRYCEEGDYEFVTPPSIDDAAYGTYLSIIDTIKGSYNALLALNIPGEDARFVLPNACCTELVMTCNLRELRHIIRERTAKAAQWEIRDLANRLKDILAREIPEAVTDLQ